MSYHINDLLTKREFDRCNEILETIYSDIEKAENKSVVYKGCMGLNTTNIIQRKLESQGYHTEQEFQYKLCRNFLKITWD